MKIYEKWVSRKEGNRKIEVNAETRINTGFFEMTRKTADPLF